MLEPLTSNKFKKVFDDVSSWLAKNMPNLHTKKNSKVLSIMLLEKQGYEISQINKIVISIYKLKIYKNSYREATRSLSAVLGEITGCLEQEKSKLRQQFERDFVNADNFYENESFCYISAQEYQAEKSKYVQSWIAKYLSSITQPDLEQAAAIGSVNGHVQVIARAGSGKTSTLVNKVLFLQKHCKFVPEQILVLAFNRKAASEIRERLAKHLQNGLPHVMTFHALAYSLVHPEEKILFNEPDGEQSKSRALQTVIDTYLRDSEFQKKICALMMAHFREDWERIVSGGYDKSPEEILQYRRSLPRESLKGEYLKSFGEKVIANFLFEHDISYKYERNFWWSGINYRPDFSIPTGEDQGLIIEYFGLKGDTDYDEISEKKRQYWKAREPNWYLIEFNPDDFKSAGVEGMHLLLKQSLESHQIPCHRLSEKEIWKRIENRAIDRFTKAMENFIQRCRKLLITPEKLVEMIVFHHCLNPIEEDFLDLAVTFYRAYLERLQITGEDDFDGLIQKSAELVASGKTIFRRLSEVGDLKILRYILIDEYQDFSKLFHCLVEAIRKQNSQLHFFCVGDDWQAVNGFAGSDLYFYQNFGQLFQPSHRLTIATNYRSISSIVNMGNTLMQGFGTPARAFNSISGNIAIADLKNFQPAPQELKDHPGDILTPAVLRLVNKAFQEGKEVVLLSRKNSLPWYVNYGKRHNNSREGILGRFLELIRSNFPKELRANITISTAHKYKGLEKKVVIILDAVPRSYPLLHPDLIFTRILGETIERVIDEERRLFYVALTRAVESLFIITETGNFSPFLDNLQSKMSIPFLNWSDCQPVVGETRRITIKISNQKGRGGNGTFAIRELLRAEGFAWKSELKYWWRSCLKQGFSVQLFFEATTWISHADGIEVQFCNDLENILASYNLDAGQWKCNFDNLSNLKS